MDKDVPDIHVESVVRYVASANSGESLVPRLSENLNALNVVVKTLGDTILIG